MKNNLKLLTLIPFLLVSLSCSTSSNQSFSSEEKTSQSESLSFDDTLPEECEEEHVLQDDEYRLVLPTYQNLNRRYYEVYLKYNDNYFTVNSNKFNKDLALLSYGQSIISEFVSEATTFYQRFGFDNPFFCSDYKITPNPDTLGYNFAHKTIGEENIIAICIRGFGYGQEWANNFMLGDEGNHEGFDARINEVMTSLTSYINNASYSNKDIKFWITGYSRGGAIANMLAQRILKDEFYGVDESKMYAYTFEAPRGLTKENALPYKSVFNIVNKADVVPMVAPQEYGLYRCGVDIEIYKDNIRELLHRYDHGIVLPKFTYMKDWFDSEDQIASGLMKLLLRPVDKDESYSMHTRELFAENYQRTIIFLMELFNKLSNRELNLIIDALKNNILSILFNEDALYETIYPILENNGYHYPSSDVKRHCSQIIKMIKGPAVNVKYTLLNQNLQLMITNHYPDINYILLKNL